ncbi:hypothetical protein ACTFIZ_007981, partial [Dictyostelium cf. discoideum]
RIIKNNNKQ